MLILRKQLENLKQLLLPQKVIILYGPRQVGKTTLLKEYLKSCEEEYVFFNGDDFEHQALLTPSTEKLKSLVGKRKLLVIDEAQKIDDIGLVLKILVDQIEGLKVIVTGSSTFDLANKIDEPLTGRKNILLVFPIAQMELAAIETRLNTESKLENKLIYGSYPEILIIEDILQRQERLKEIVRSYLFKDILELDGLKHSKKIYSLLQLLAYQLGSEVSHNELGTQLSMDNETVSRYLDLLEKAFVIFERGGYSTNLRSEVKKTKKYYFFDLGVRNAIINNFNFFDQRDPKEAGMLWENYIVVERMKFNEYTKFKKGTDPKSYFWRTYEQQEIDLIEEVNNQLYAFEIKWNKEYQKPPLAWEKKYPQSRYLLINKNNYLDFIGANGEE